MKKNQNRILKSKKNYTIRTNNTDTILFKLQLVEHSQELFLGKKKVEITLKKYRFSDYFRTYFQSW